MNSKDDIRGSSRMRIVLAPAGRRVSDACHEQKCLNIFARTRNLSSPFFLIERPCFILDMINQIFSHRARSKDSNRSTGERVFDVQFLLPTFLYGVLSKFFSFFLVIKFRHTVALVLFIHPSEQVCMCLHILLIVVNFSVGLKTSHGHKLAYMR